MTVFRFLTSGESHGKCLNAIIDGIPAGFVIDKEFIDSELARRQSGYGRGGRMQIETDKVRINSGVRFGITTGAPAALEVMNKDWENWTVPMSVEPVDMNDLDNRMMVESKAISRIRPGHADFAGAIKYNHEDIRNILERSSARETAARVAVGAFAKCILKEFDITCSSKILKIGGVSGDEEIKKAIDKAKEEGDTLGGSFEIIFNNLPVGLGSFVQWDRRLDGRIAQAVMSIQAIKSVEIGAGSQTANMAGSDTHDEVFYENGNYFRKTNNAGGIEGGMTNGEPLVVRASMKAIPTMKKALKSVDLKTKEAYEAHFERSDTCAVEACSVVAESMIAIILTDAFLEKFGADSLREIKTNYDNYKEYLKSR